MSLATEIDARLWAAVQNAYEAGNYTGAILDSIHFLGDLIREKSGLDSDGHQLIGAAFGGQNPIIKVNSLHTESDREEQRGVEFLLRGVYTAIRNPRSHEKRVDSNETADVLIRFVDYLDGQIDKSRSPFDKQEMIRLVADKHFAHNDKYADILVARIPQRKRLDLLIEVFNRRSDIPSKNLVRFIKAALRTLTDTEQSEFWEIASESLEAAAADAEFRSVIQIAEGNWLSLSEIPRIRTEHRLIESMREGEYDDQKKMCPKGALGSWAMNIAKEFVLRDEYVAVATTRFASANPAARAYILQYHFDNIRELSPEPPSSLVWAIKRHLREHDQSVYNALNFLVLEDESNAWHKELNQAYESFYSESPAVGDDDIPF
jgi:uncharacterized protein (TIGR02391 family)